MDDTLVYIFRSKFTCCHYYVTLDYFLHHYCSKVSWQCSAVWYKTKWLLISGPNVGIGPFVPIKMILWIDGLMIEALKCNI